MTGKHDDRIMACMIALHGILYEHYVVSYQTVDVKRIYKNPVEEFDSKLMA
jgi:hypothetical protein